MNSIARAAKSSLKSISKDIVNQSIMDYHVFSKYENDLDDVIFDYIGENVSLFPKSMIRDLLLSYPNQIIYRYHTFSNVIEQNIDLLDDLFSLESISVLMVHDFDEVISIVEGLRSKVSNDILITIVKRIGDYYSDQITLQDFTELLLLTNNMREVKKLMISVGVYDGRFDDYTDNWEEIRNEYLQKNGHVVELEFPIGKIMDMYETNPLSMCFLTHTIDDTGKVVSIPELCSNNRDSLMDSVSHIGIYTDYYTPSVQMTINFVISSQSCVLIDIFKDDYLSNYYYSIRHSQIDYLNEIILNSQIIEEIEYIYTTVRSIVMNESHFVIIYGESLFIASIIEKLLRLLIKKEDGEDNHGSMNELVENLTIGRVLGQDLVKWMSFWMLSSSGAGKDYRNRIAHWDSIEMKDLSVETVTSFLFFFDSVLTSIYLYYSNKCLDVSENESF